MSSKWNLRFLELAEHVAGWSKDASSKVGCVLVHLDRTILSLGYNGFPRGVEEHEERNQRPAKYLYTSHGEANAVFNAIRNGIALKGCVAYVTHMPCADCARALIQVDCSRVVAYDPKGYPGLASRLTDSYQATTAMLAEAGIRLDLIEKEHHGN